MARSLLAAAFAAGLTLGPAGSAVAFPDAALEAQDRPCWNLFPDPAIAIHCKKPSTPPPPHRVGGDTVIHCERSKPGDVSRALAKLPPGATLYLVAGVRPCVDSLRLTKPVTIMGSPGYLPGVHVPTLLAIPGAPCAVMEAGAGAVTLSNLVIAREGAGAGDCLIQQGGVLTLNSTWVRYSGEGAALSAAAGGRTVMAGSVIAGRTRAAAVDIAGALDMDRSAILAAVSGLHLDPGEDSRIHASSIVRLDDWTGSERASHSTGMIETGSSDRLVQIDGLSVAGFSRGVALIGTTEVAMQDTVIRESDWGVVAQSGRVRVVGGDIEASELGVYAASGDTWVANVRIAGVMRAGIFLEKGARLHARDNEVFPNKAGCDAMAGGLEPGSQTCRPWFEAPEFYRTGRRADRPTYAVAWPDAAAMWSSPAPVVATQSYPLEGSR